MIKVIGLNTKVLKKEPFSGSHHGMRFFMRAKDDTLHVWVYPEPWCFEKTPDDVKTMKDFPFTQEGLDASLEWISQEFDNKKDYWTAMEHNAVMRPLQQLAAQGVAFDRVPCKPDGSLCTEELETIASSQAVMGGASFRTASTLPCPPPWPPCWQQA